MAESKKKTKKVHLNGLDITVESQKSVLISDKMGNVSNSEAQQICLYLYREGFLETDDIICQIIKD
tara:strand:+ start:2125 stop:2322 length:198 start_codon:yes stop_codon:yes gene_type:complete